MRKRSTTEDTGDAADKTCPERYVASCPPWWRACSIVLVVAVLSGPSAAQPPVAAPVAIAGARLIDGTGTAPIADSVVIVEGDRIRAAGPRARVQVPRGAMVVDATGKSLMPGLVDVHCHINQPPEDMKRYWIAQLRWGVTTLRSAGNDKPETVPLFRQTRAPRHGSAQAGAFL